MNNILDWEANENNSAQFNLDKGNQNTKKDTAHREEHAFAEKYRLENCAKMV